MENRYTLVGTCRFCSFVGMVSGEAHFRIGFIVAVILSATSTAAAITFPALIFFGDSTLDVGTNNYLDTVIKSDFLPYGRDLHAKGQPSAGSGRFSNGLVPPDYVASFFGLPCPLPYLNPNADGDKLLEGINFASAGSGWLNSTGTIYSVRSIPQQQQDFKDYVGRLTQLVGPNRAQDFLNNALFIISSGSNDYILNYYLFQSKNYTVLQWQDFITTTVSQLLQEIYDMGGRRIVVSSLPAIGCLPAAISLFGGGSNRCVDHINGATVNTNSAIQQIVQNFDGNEGLPGAQLRYNDIYDGLLNAVADPVSYGFEQVRFACCGTGTIEVAILCNSDSPDTCSDASKFLFFDSFHPTQNFYANISQTIIQRILATF